MEGVVTLKMPLPRSCLQSDDNHNGQIDKQQYDQREQDQRRRDDQRRQDNQKRQDDQRRKEDNVNGSRILAFSDERCSTTNWCSYKQMKTKNGTEITLIIGKDEMKFRINKTGGVIGDELEREVFDCYYRTEKTLKWHSIEEVISIFERLVIFLYNGAIAIGHIEFQQEIKTLITELVSTYEKGIKMMQQYQVMFCAVLRNEGKPEYKQNVYYIFYEGFEQLSHIFIQVSDAHEKLTDLQKALDEAAKLTQYNECVIESLQITVSCCIDGIQLLCECSRKCLQKRLERPVHKATNSALEDLSRSVEGIAFIFVAIERFQMLIEISERTIQNINKEIHKTITVDMAKGMVRKTIFTIPSLKSLFEYHHEKFKKMSILDYLD